MEHDDGGGTRVLRFVRVGCDFGTSGSDASGSCAHSRTNVLGLLLTTNRGGRGTRFEPRVILVRWIGKCDAGAVAGRDEGRGSNAGLRSFLF
jgi:hypothetical protein